MSNVISFDNIDISGGYMDILLLLISSCVRFDKLAHDDTSCILLDPMNNLSNVLLSSMSLPKLTSNILFWVNNNDDIGRFCNSFGIDSIWLSYRTICDNCLSYDISGGIVVILLLFNSNILIFLFIVNNSAGIFSMKFWLRLNIDISSFLFLVKSIINGVI